MQKLQEGFTLLLFIDNYLNTSFKMTNDVIEKYVAPRQSAEKEIKIFFKQRSTITGIFVKGNDYDSLKSKNFWRIVTNSNIAQWKKTKDLNLAKIFNGVEFTKLSE